MSNGPYIPWPPTIPLPMQEWRKQSFDLAADSAKQLITVSAGIITITVLFSKDLGTVPRAIALFAWLVFLLSITCGVFAVFNMSGNLHNAADGRKAFPSIKSKGVTRCLTGQIFFFLVGLLLILVFGYFAITNKSVSEDKKPVINNFVQEQMQQLPTKPAQASIAEKPGVPPAIHHQKSCTCKRRPSDLAR
jgi:hypothetical protein